MSDGPAEDRYSVFLSYNSRDYDTVRSIAQSLENRGLTVFIDRWYLVPGMPWPDRLEGILSRCGAVAVFVGPHGMGRWQQSEKNVALDRKTREPDFPVIPVLLPGSDPALGFLFLNTWADLRDRVDDPNGLRILAGAIEGRAPGPDVQLRTLTAQSTVCPYRGLHYFREEDAPFFFGRDAFIERLEAMIDRRPLVAVVGASGSGKSSAVRAGLTPRLRNTKGARVWEIATIVPGDRPLRALAAVLSPLLEPELAEVARLKDVTELADALAAGKVALRDVVTRAVEKQSGTDRLMLIVDQWEEIYTQARDEASRQKFIDSILDATASAPLSVVLAMRGDFFGQALAYRRFSDAIQDGVLNVSRMTNEELTDVIENPANKVGMRFEPGLVTRILEHVSEEPGNLPLLEFVLTELWKERDDEMLTHTAYAKIGGLRGAIAAHAEAAFLSLPQSDQETARRVFLQLVRPATGDDGPTRTRMPFSELSPESVATVRKLADEHLLVTGRSDATGEELVDLVHETLIEAWSRLRSWIDDDREFLDWRERLRALMALDEPALMKGRRLAEARKWLVHSGDALSTSEREYIEKSSQRVRSDRLAWAAIPVMLVAIYFYGNWIERRERERAAAAATKQLTLAPEFFKDAAQRASTLRLLGVSSLEMRERIVAILGPPPPNSTLSDDRTAVIDVEQRTWLEPDEEKNSSLMAQGVLEIAPRARFVYISHVRLDSSMEKDLTNALDRMQRRNLNPRVLLIPYSSLNAHAARQAIESAVRRGLLVVVPGFGVLHEQSLTVASVDLHGDFPGFSKDYANLLWAPGNDTHRAAALAAGVALRVYDRHWESTNDELLRILRKTARPVMPNGPPILNLDAALAELER